ncbi:hypothetical protein BEL04_08560 [Mucilaginibacter sp. PPCGB 2223]|uniref:TlpA family protein disulfide reductase n=1 Tax=Mucilaginibacter sp. PPCGB 2223 TaxID=1886027 RepID=UPI0008259855|nr:TlpA disulfide reductase family protein [Mucilaginibacter sp. PPCGB 2223]OCX54300.1 hypothetical protein BEL04_08560 [Mucilaginibacter sp. PPCGB 2223]
MKHKLCLLPLLCLFLTANAQEKTIPNKDGTSPKNTLTPKVAIGDTVPDILITGISNLSLNWTSRSTVHLSDFKGKLLIIDFWATWCAPCRAMIPKMDSLQRVFGDKIIFLPVSYESKATVTAVLDQVRKQQPFDLPEVTGDKSLQLLFPHRELPHYVWIDSKGVLRATTGFEQVTPLNIRRMLKDPAGNTGLRQKQDVRISYDNQKPLFIGGNGGSGGTLRYHSLLSGVQEGIGGGMNISAPDSLGQRFTVRNSPLIWLARLAFADHNRWFPSARVRLDSKDSLNMNSKLTGQAYGDWLKAGNGWCYELQVPPSLRTSAFAIIREDLDRLFPAYSIITEQRTVPSLVLIRTSENDKLKSSGAERKVDVGPYACHLHNAPLSALMMRLERQYLQNSPLPIADGTGYTGMVDLDLEARLSNLDALNKELAKYDLQFIEKPYPAEILVIRDKPTLKP